jgi:hypothetical protein
MAKNCVKLRNIGQSQVTASDLRHPNRRKQSPKCLGSGMAPHHFVHLLPSEKLFNIFSL